MKITNPPIPPFLKGGKGGLKPIFGLKYAYPTSLKTKKGTL